MAGAAEFLGQFAAERVRQALPDLNVSARQEGVGRVLGVRQQHVAIDDDHAPYQNVDEIGHFFFLCQYVRPSSKQIAGRSSILARKYCSASLTPWL